MSRAALNNTKEAPGHRKRGRRVEYAHWRQIRTRWTDNDIYGHVNNVVYHSFFDTAVNATLIRLGLLDFATSEVIGLVVERGCRYAASLAFPDDVDAGIRVARLGNTSVRYEAGLFRTGKEEAAAEGYFGHVYVARDTRRPITLPAEWPPFLETLQIGEAA